MIVFFSFRWHLTELISQSNSEKNDSFFRKPRDGICYLIILFYLHLTKDCSAHEINSACGTFVILGSFQRLGVTINCSHKS